MAKVKISKYGWPLIKEVVPDEAWHYYEQFYMIDETDPDCVYKCFTDDAKRIIWKEEKKNSVTTLTFSYGAWDDRSNLTYAPINGSLEVEI